MNEGDSGHHEVQAYSQTNLVSDGAVSAVYTDSNLVNPWGISFSSPGPSWVSDNGKGVSTLYNDAGQPFPLPPASPAGGHHPTTHREVSRSSSGTHGTGLQRLIRLCDKGSSYG